VAERERLLLDREAELSVLHAAVESATDGWGTVTLLDGPSGIGKTALLDATRDWARQRQVRVLSGRCAEVERAFSFGLVRQLFATAVTRDRQRSGVLSGVAALAAPLFERGDRAPEIAASPLVDDVLHARLDGLYWLTSNLAEQSPLLVAVDDAHLADDASLRFLGFLARRVDELPVSVVLAVRAGDGPRRDAFLAQVGTGSSTRVLRLAPLGAEAVRTMTGALLDRPVGREFARVAHEVIGGNPYLVRVLVEELERTGLAPDDATAPQLRGPAGPVGVRAHPPGVPLEPGLGPGRRRGRPRRRRRPSPCRSRGGTVGRRDARQPTACRQPRSSTPADPSGSCTPSFGTASIPG
jgi:hypothetical protein